VSFLYRLHFAIHDTMTVSHYNVTEWYAQQPSHVRAKTTWEKPPTHGKDVLAWPSFPV
jgi:hypothetical protein